MQEHFIKRIPLDCEFQNPLYEDATLCQDIPSYAEKNAVQTINY